MKKMARIAAGVSFVCFFLSGLTILMNSQVQVYRDGFVLACIGLLFIGTAFFVGPLLWLAAEKWAPKPQEPAPDAPSQPWSWKAGLAVIGAVVGVMIAIYLVRAFNPGANPLPTATEAR